ncbi:hypothetical protein [Bacillus sp. FJAT-49736]|uniref:hypothetical protein n=1 Tax=Bacillus sp. FJAT-49736 TaxID=2833582 RepID=UPI001BC9DD3C|nr:hypothetical protein [Bacillus sp. FJAT-49736]MBS4174268.1 hypothetical protein [Bacillus sp. FJAT-49736]
MNSNEQQDLQRDELDELDNLHPLQQKYKILTEIVHSNLDFKLSKKVKTNGTVNKILDINWSIHPVKYQINLSANHIWVSGKLIGEITYTKGKDTKIHLQMIKLPWKTTSKLEYKSPPLYTQSNQKRQYEFTEADHNTEIIHYEQIIYNNEIPKFEVIQTKVITSHSMEKKDKYAYLLLNVNCEMEYRILQNQIHPFEP